MEKKVECFRKGRRIAKAYSHAMGALRAMKAEADAWTLAIMGGSQQLLTSAQGTIRGIFFLAELQLNSFDCIPFLLSRLNVPGVRDRAIAQYLSTAPKNHHRVSRLLFDPAM